MIAQTVRGSFPRRAVAALIPLAAWIQLTAGCATYGYAARGPPPDSTTVPIDRMTPQESSRWSFFWGTVSSIWSPLKCTESDAAGRCTRTKDPCEGLGAGEVHLNLAWYSVPMAVLTLGMAVPGKITVYCSTLRAPERGP